MSSITSDSIDWASVHARLAENEERLAAMLNPTPEMARAKLVQRAAVIRNRGMTPAPEATEEIIVFRTGEDHFGISLLSIREVVALTAYTPVPGAPPHVLGIQSVRGAIHCIIDPRAVESGHSAGSAVELKYGLILRQKSADVALAAGAVYRIAKVPSKWMEGEELIRIDGKLARVLTLTKLIDALRIISN
jgi:chemotaxis signal transduction protein